MERRFIQQFQDHSEHNYQLSELDVSFFRSTAHYMNKRWTYNHEYFQRMIERDARTNPDMNIALGIKEGNPHMIVLAVQQGIHLHNPAVIALANAQGNRIMLMELSRVFMMMVPSVNRLIHELTTNIFLLTRFRFICK